VRLRLLEAIQGGGRVDRGSVPCEVKCLAYPQSGGRWEGSKYISLERVIFNYSQRYKRVRPSHALDVRDTCARVLGSS
jgi:hypothetical protein